MLAVSGDSEEAAASQSAATLKLQSDNSPGSQEREQKERKDTGLAVLAVSVSECISVDSLG